MFRKLLICAAVVAVALCLSQAFAQCPGGSCGSPYVQGGFSGGCQGGQCGQTQWMPVSRIEQKPTYFPEVPRQRMVSIEGNASNGVPKCQYPALVRVHCKGNQSDTVGTGFVADVFDGKAVIVTCAHGYKALQDVEVHTQDGGRHSATVIGVDSVKDLLICVIKDPGIKPLAMAEQPPVIGDKVYMAGFPGGSTFLGSWGQVVGWVSPSQVFQNTFMSTNCVSKSGCSGGPIMNEKGEVVAIVTGNMQINSGQGGCVGPCLSKTLPEMNVARIAYKTAGVDYDQSMMPWRNKMEKSQQATNRELQQISGTLRAIQTSPPPAPVQVAPPAVVQAGPDYGPAINQINGVLQEHGRQISRIPDMIEERVGPLDEKVSTIGENIAKHGTLLERIASAKAEDPEKSTLAAIKEAIAVRFRGDREDDDSKTERLEGKWAKWLVLLGIVASLVYWHKNKHGPVAGLMERFGRPELAERETALHDKIHGKIHDAVRSGIAAAGVATGNPIPAAGVAIDKIHDVKSLLESLHAKMDANTAVSTQAAQAATAAAVAPQQPK